jgi:hypothetical protein
MTIKKAIGALYSACSYNGSGQYTSDELEEAKKILRRAARKQIPKKLVCIGIEQCCPVCKEGVCSIGDDGCYGNYCTNCGQALDWGDTE